MNANEYRLVRGEHEPIDPRHPGGQLRPIVVEYVSERPAHVGIRGVRWVDRQVTAVEPNIDVTQAIGKRVDELLAAGWRPFGGIGLFRRPVPGT